MSIGIVGIFVAGLFTFVTPCVLPLIPIYLSALIGGDIRQLSESKDTGRGQLIFRALLFSAGFITVFTLLGLTASSIGAFLADHKAIVEGFGALLILIFGLKFSGLIRIPFFDRVVRADDNKLKTRFGGINALVMGFVFAAGWSPCVGPVLGSVLTYTASTTSDPLTGALYLGVYGFGFALPLLVTAAFAQAGVRFLRRINPYLPKIERAIGAFLIIVSLSLMVDLGMRIQYNQTSTDTETLDTYARDEQGQAWPLMVEFHSQGCPICERMEPIVTGIENQCHGQKVRVKTIDVSDEENRHYIAKYRLVGVPTFLFLDKDNNEVARLVGEQEEQDLKQALSALRGEPCPGVGPLPGDEGKPYQLIFPEQNGGAVSCGSGLETEEPTGTPGCEEEPETEAL